MANIVRVSQDYAGLAWVCYDVAYRQQAATTSSCKWSVVNPTLYTTCFTGAERTGTSRCELCFATSHSDQGCAQRGNLDLGLPDRLKAVKSVVLSLSNGASASGRRPPQVFQPSEEICRLWNNNMCRFCNCHYTHLCKVRRRKHPAVACPKKGGHPSQGGPLGSQGRAFQARPYQSVTGTS